MHPHRDTDPARLVAKLLREMLAAERFSSDADVKEALKRRCAQLKIHDDGDLVHRALDLVASNRDLSTPDDPARLSEHPADPPAISTTAAKQLLARFGVTVRTVPTVRELTPDEYLRRRFAADRAKALQIVTDAILEAERRGADREREDP